MEPNCCGQPPFIMDDDVHNGSFHYRWDFIGLDSSTISQSVALNLPAIAHREPLTHRVNFETGNHSLPRGKRVYFLNS